MQLPRLVHLVFLMLDGRSHVDNFTLMDNFFPLGFHNKRLILMLDLCHRGSHYISRSIWKNRRFFLVQFPAANGHRNRMGKFQLADRRC